MWNNMKEIWIENDRNCNKYKFYIKRKKWVKVFKFIRNNKPFDKYVVDTVELDQILTINNKFKYLMTYVVHFSNYTCVFILIIKLDILLLGNYF